MNILYVYQGDWPRNAVRPLKQTKALAARGHRVHMLSGNPQGKPRHSAESWMTIERLPSFGSPRAHRVLGFPVFLNPVWLGALLRSARRCRAEALIVVDLPLAPAAVIAGIILGVPVHFDVADVYPVGMRDSRIEHPGWVGRITRNPSLAEVVERYVLRRVANVFVVSDESRDRYVAMGVDPQRLSIVGNTPEFLHDSNRDYLIPADIADWAGRPLMLFVGNLLPSRGLPVAIETTAMAAREVPEFGFVIVGDGRELAPLRQLIAERGLTHHVRLVGWKPSEEHAAYYAHAAFGVLPFRATQHICITLANKLFDYMNASLPVLASDVPPMRRVLEETGAGLLAAPGDVEGFTRAALQLVGDRDLRRRLGCAGRRAIETKYSWAEDGRRFVDAIERVGPTRRGKLA